MLIFILEFILIMILILSIYLFRKDIMQPSVIVTAVFTISVLTAMYNIENWNINIHFNTFFVILGSVILFVFINFCVIILFDSKRKKPQYKSANYENRSAYINVSKFKIFALMLFDVLVMAWHYKYIKSIASAYGMTQSFSSITNAYRQYSLYESSVYHFSEPFLLELFSRVETYSAYIFLYIFVNNIIVTKKIKKNILYSIPIIMFIIDSVLYASRGRLLYVIAATVILSYVLKNRRLNWMNKASIKFVIKIIIAFIVLLGGFVALRTVVGRSMGTLATEDPIYYVTVYTGGPIQLLDMYLQSPAEHSSIWGYETFSELNNYLGSKFGISELVYSTHLEFRYSNGLCVGNVYTALRSYISDFGYIGLTVLIVICSSFYSIFYNIIKSNRKNMKFDFLLLVYAYMIQGVFMFSIAERPFSTYFTPGIITTLVMMWLLQYFFTRVNIRICKNIKLK